MKKIFAFLFLLLGLTSTEKTLAQRGRGQIAVHSEDGEKLGIEVSGRRYDRFSADFVLGNIPAGRRSVTIYRLKPHRRDGGATAQTVYEGQLLVRAGYQILLRVNAQSGAVSIQHIEMTPPSGRAEASAPSPPARTPPLAIPQGGTAQNSTWKREIQDKNTDTEKLRILKSYVQNRAVSTAELVEMMAALAFEDSRLELAQAALPHLSDRENSSTISEAFENPASRKAFDEAARRL